MRILHYILKADSTKSYSSRVTIYTCSVEFSFLMNTNKCDLILKIVKKKRKLSPTSVSFNKNLLSSFSFLLACHQSITACFHCLMVITITITAKTLLTKGYSGWVSFCWISIQYAMLCYIVKNTLHHAAFSEIWWLEIIIRRGM